MTHICKCGFVVHSYTEMFAHRSRDEDGAHNFREVIEQKLTGIEKQELEQEIYGARVVSIRRSDFL